MRRWMGDKCRVSTFRRFVLPPSLCAIHSSYWFESIPSARLFSFQGKLERQGGRRPRLREQKVLVGETSHVSLGVRAVG